MKPPALWGLWSRVYGLETGRARQLWHAVQASRWSVVVAWRQDVVFFESRVVDDPATCLQGVWTPERLTGVLEALVHEGRLQRSEATAIEERVFAMLTADGSWK